MDFSNLSSHVSNEGITPPHSPKKLDNIKKSDSME
jgi:hypothetical protein